MDITGRDKYDMSFITKDSLRDSLRNQFRSDLTTESKIIKIFIAIVTMSIYDFLMDKNSLEKC